MTHATPVLEELDPVTDEPIGPRLGVVVLQELGGGWFVDVASPGCDLRDHRSERDHVTVLIHDDPVGIDEHADPVLVGVDPELRDDMEAEAPAAGALPDVDELFGAAQVPVRVSLVVNTALHTVVVRTQVASLCDNCTTGRAYLHGFIDHLKEARVTVFNNMSIVHVVN